EQKDQKARARAGLGQAEDQKHHQTDPEQAQQQGARAQRQQHCAWNGGGQQQGEIVGVGEQAQGAASPFVDVVQRNDTADADAQPEQAGQPQEVEGLVEQQGQHEQRKAHRQLTQGFQRQRKVPAAGNGKDVAEQKGQQQLPQIAAQALLGQLPQEQLQRHHQDQGVAHQLAAGDGAALRKQAFDRNHRHQTENAPGGPLVQHAQGDQRGRQQRRHERQGAGQQH